MDLLDECVSVLLSTENKCEILSPANSKQIYKLFFATYPFTHWGQIDWEKVNHEKCYIIGKILPILKKIGKKSNQEVFIIWGDINLPVLKCILVDALHNINEITPLGIYATWLFCPSESWTIEFWHHGEIMLGFSK